MRELVENAENSSLVCQHKRELFWWGVNLMSHEEQYWPGIVPQTQSVTNGHPPPHKHWFPFVCSKKWKKLLTFPHVSECINLSTTLKSDSYDYIVDQQPIGQVLFRQFCENSKWVQSLKLPLTCNKHWNDVLRKPYSHYNNFLDDVYNYETDLEENRISLAHQIFSKYLTKPQGGWNLLSSLILETPLI